MNYSEATKALNEKREAGLLTQDEAQTIQTNIDRIQTSSKHWRLQHKLFDIWCKF